MAEPQEAPATPSFEDRAAFLLRLRERGIRDLAVLRAMEAVPRAAFVADRYAAFATRDIALPADRGQSVPESLTVARLLAGSRLETRHRVLLVGLGAGYTTAVLSHLVQEVVAVDRVPSLVAAAAQRFAALGRTNIEVRCGDGLMPAESELFDRILLLGSLAEPPLEIWASLKPDGLIVHARDDAPAEGGAQCLVRVEKQSDGIGRQAILGPSRLTRLRNGVVGSPGEA